MKRRTAWALLLLTGIPTPALWRPASSGNTAPARRTGSSSNGLRVTVRVSPVPLAHGAPSAPAWTAAWLSDDPDVAAALAVVPAAPPAATPPRPRTRRQAVATAPGASSLPAQQLADAWDASRGA